MVQIWSVNFLPGVRIQITYGNDRHLMPGFYMLNVSDLPDSQTCCPGRSYIAPRWGLRVHYPAWCISRKELLEVEIPGKYNTLMCPRAFIASEDETAQACMEVFIPWPCVTRGPVAEVRSFLTTIAHGGCRSAARDAIYTARQKPVREGSEERVTSISHSQKDLVSPYVNFICPQSSLSALMFATCDGTVDVVRELLASGVRIHTTYGNDRHVMPGFRFLMVSDLPDSQH